MQELGRTIIAAVVVVGLSLALGAVLAYDLYANLHRR